MAEHQSKAKNWCFTWNNYTGEDIEYLINEVVPDCKYLIFGKEIGENETIHLQGFVSFATRKNFNRVRTMFKNNHIEPARNVLASIQYCKKDNDFEEYGEIGPTQGQRQDLETFKNDVKQNKYTVKELRDKHSLIFAKYPRFALDYVADNVARPEVVVHPLREWQQNLTELLQGEPNSRSIVFIVDTLGNKGKSWFARYYASTNENVQIVQPGKKADMAYALDTMTKVLFLDAPRSKQGEYIQYDFLEHVKDGMIFSPKYESRIKMLGPCHVVVLMNEMPDMTKLSEDRYTIINIE